MALTFVLSKKRSNTKSQMLSLSWGVLTTSDLTGFNSVNEYTICYNYYYWYENLVSFLATSKLWEAKGCLAESQPTFSLRSGGERSVSQNLVQWYINEIICNISWISSEEIVRFTGFSNVHYFSGTPILCKDILEISFPIKLEAAKYFGFCLC